MKDFIAKLTEKTGEFGNHYRKYMQAVSKHLNQLIQRLEEKKKRDAVDIFHPAYDFGAGLTVVSDVAENTKEKLYFIGTYFALQFLLINRQAIDLLRMDIINSGADKYPVYKKFMRSAGDSFRMLTANYIKELLDIFVDEDKCPAFAILGVGTKSDHDDIDVGMIDNARGDRKGFNRAIAYIGQEMLKFAITFHFHLSEHIGDNYYSASISEYKKALRHEIKDFVIINEMLSAAVICGSEKLFKEYQKEITDRYFYHPQGDNKYHEGYLRGIVGEVCSLLARPISSTRINFKEDGMRAIKSIIGAQKTIFNVDRVNAWDILDSLKGADPKRSHEYNALEKSLTFFEIFRYLHQLFVTQDEEIILEDSALKNIRSVAKVIGYKDMGKCSAEEHILVHYYEHINNLRRTIPILVDDIKRHLRSTSTFAPVLSPKYAGNIAEDFIKKFTFFKGTSFWDDVLDSFNTELLIDKFVNDINSLKQKRRKEVIKQYIDLFKYDLYSLINLITTLGRNKNSFSIFEALNAYLLKTIETIPSVVRNIAYIFNSFPYLINGYLSLNNEYTLRLYLKILRTRKFEKDIASIVDDLESLIRLHLSSSMFFKRFFLRILDKYPESIQLLKYADDLQEFADGIYSDVESMQSFKEKKEKLGDYYDFETMRVGIKTLGGTSVDETNAEFTEFSDKYILTLFELCRREIDTQYDKKIITDDLLAIFAAGGHAREQAYDDDYDMIVLLNSDNPDMLSYCNRIISKMNNEIIKRGTIPHHRFTDYFGRFVVLLEELEQLLIEKRPDIFVEKSQMLGARLIVGSHRFEKEFLQKIVKSHIFDMKEEYITQMVDEINSRHRSTEDETMEVDSDIKECSGGLRDIEMMMLILKAKFSITEPVNSRLFSSVAETQKELKRDLQDLAKAFDFLKNLRDVYRLTAGASDIIMLEALDTAAQIMDYKTGEELHHKFKQTNEDVKTAIANLIAKL